MCGRIIERLAFDEFPAIGNAIHVALHPHGYFIAMVCKSSEPPPYASGSFVDITKTRLYYFDPLKPHFYIVKLGFTGGIHYYSYFCSKT